MQEIQETLVQPQGQEDRLYEEMLTDSSILTWKILPGKIPLTEESGGLQSMGLLREGYK